MIIHDVEQGTNEWCTLRSGLPTASAFSKIVTSTGAPSKSIDDYANILAGEIFAGKSLDEWSGNKYTERGKELEDTARSTYEMLYDVDVQQVGFITNDEKTFGCSPDGLVGDDGMHEIKCQIAKEHIKTILYFKKHGKCPTTYVQQTQGQMMVTGRKWCDLMFFHPDLPPLIIRQYPIKAVVDGLAEAIEQLIEKRDITAQIMKDM